MALTAAILSALKAASAASPFEDAVAVWHMADASGRNGTLTVQGGVKLGVELTGTDRDESLRRGGDGRAAEFSGGWLTVGKDAGGGLSVTGRALTVCLRLRDPSGAWAAGLLSRKDKTKNYNLFAWDLGRGMEFGFECDLRGEQCFRQARVPLAGLAADGWHDLVARCDGAKLEFFVDGVLRDTRAAAGELAGAEAADFMLGADPGGKNAFHGLIDHAALWNRALTDTEVVSLCGGREAVEKATSIADKADAAIATAAAAPASYAHVGWWKQRHEEKLALVKQGGWRVVFIGDSITHGWESDGKPVWEKYYAPRHALNLGFGGDSVQSALWRLENGELDGLSPDVAIVMIGTNNTGMRHPPRTIFYGVRAIVDAIRRRSPGTKVLLLAIFPRSATATDFLRLNNEDANALIAKLADDQHVFYLNINKVFLEPDGTLAGRIMPDLLHPGQHGYELWAEAMEPTLKKLLGESGVTVAAASPKKEASFEEKLAVVRQRAGADPCYPGYHLAPLAGWMNDPHPVFFNGAYHVFYQYSFIPDNPYGGPHCWGHAESRDLVHWRHMPPAITPEEHGIAPDRHIWSGCVVDSGGGGTAIYTIENRDIWIATSRAADLATFERYPGNPVIRGPPPGLEIEGGMRDPWVWKESDGWYLTLGSGLKNGRGSVLPLYKSADLVHWQYLHPLFQGDPARDGVFCECPCFFPLGNKHVLLLSDRATYLVGRYEDHRFVPEKRGQLDYGNVYVPQTLLDAKGRQILWGWVQETRDRNAMARAGWASMQTLPRVMTLLPDNTLAFDPAEELTALRTERREFRDVRLTAGAPHPIDGVKGGQLEFAVEFVPPANGAVGLVLEAGPVRAEIVYDGKSRTVASQHTSAPLALAKDEPLSLRVFVDRSVIEVFANRHVCITGRFYPENPDAMQAALFARGEDGLATRVDAWTLGTAQGRGHPAP